jgi:hypothetical protein
VDNENKLYRFKNKEIIDKMLRGKLVRFVDEEDDETWLVDVLEEAKGFPLHSVIIAYPEDLDEVDEKLTCQCFLCKTK